MTSEVNPSGIVTDGTNPIDLYIDYSTCVSEAIQSSYYQAVHPVIVDCNPVYYSIKGNKITEETTDRQMVYQLLRSVKEVNNAEIKVAVNKIVNGNRQAVLITDGEYFMPGVTGDNLNNPYLAEEFRTWLKKGHDIYIYSEPYLESNKFNKYRYYMLFTDCTIDNNIQQKFQRSAPADPNVKMFHLSMKAPGVTFDKTYPQINDALSMNEAVSSANNHYEVEEFQTGWEDIYSYLKENAVDAMGNPLPKGDFVMRGLFLKSSDSDAFKISELDVLTYNVYPSYAELRDSITNNGAMPKCTLGEPLSKVFVIDEDIYKKTGEIVLRLDPDFDGSSLSSEGPNLLRVDIVVKKSEENFTTNPQLAQNFKWTSISARNAGRENTSLYESIRQVLIDPQMHPENYSDKVVYTFYLNTLKM
ncbi:hypothetical protein [uncultured Bacteroides sp.]|uniref:hypothetical protein n=1 Tax=uncultured Bacteroides sp. TaxID=162156 RepID=UPI0026048564|nr:hypothetical protein [uncultured Bacteroides sp.]